MTCSEAKNECVVEAGHRDKSDSRREGQTGHRPTGKITCPTVGQECPPSSAVESTGHRNPPQPTSEEAANQGLVRETHQAHDGGVAGHGLGRVTHQPCSGEVAGQGLGPGEPVPCVSLLIPRCIPGHALAGAAGCDTHTLRSFSSMPFIFSMALSAASCVSKCTNA